jgi:leucine dehydrogenase
MQLLDNPKSETKQILQTLLKKQHGDTIFERLPIRGYELVLKITNPKTRLLAIVAIHNTYLGPALGGTRIYPYPSFNTALTDVLRLSEGMTYKSAMTGVGFGGGKSVIIADPKKDKTEELLFSFGEAVDQLQGLYICAEDSGCTLEDARTISKKTKYIVGLPSKKSSGNPSPYTAWGTFVGIQSVAQKMFGSRDLKGKKIAIQGLGSVGMHIAEYLFWAGADLIVADPSPLKIQKAVNNYNAKPVALNEITTSICDVFVPCALGGVIHSRNISSLRCKAIAGCANNQLDRPEDAELLRKRGILYAPDFVINSGGLLNVAGELLEAGYNSRFVINKVYEIFDRLMAIYEIAEKNDVSTHSAACSLAEYRVKYGLGKRTTPPFFHHVS